MKQARQKRKALAVLLAIALVFSCMPVFAVGAAGISENVDMTVKSVTYTVYYDANGGTGAPGDQTKIHGVDLVLSTDQPVQTGYIFLGWAESSTVTTATYAPGDSYTVDNSITLYAVWQQDEPGFKLGDVNGDGDIDIGDVNVVYLHVRGKRLLTGDTLLAADVNKDGDVDIGDVNRIYLLVRGKITSL